MSTEAVKWAMDDAPMLRTDKGKPDTTSRHVLQALAEHAHKDGSGARPSVLRLQYRTGYDRRTIQRALRRLEDGKLITAKGVVHGCTNYTLALKMRRPASDWEALEAEEEELRRATAERVRKHRASRVTHSDDVTVTHANDVTEPDVTHSASVRNASEVRYVTHSDDVRNARNAARTINEPSLEPPGTDRADGRRPTTGSRTDRTSGSAALQNAAPDSTNTAAIRIVIGLLPPRLRDHLPNPVPRVVTDTITDQLRAGLTADQLIARAERRWREHGYELNDDTEGGGPGLLRPVGVAAALLRRGACTHPRCNDGTDLDTGQPCRTCEREAEGRRRHAPQAPVQGAILTAVPTSTGEQRAAPLRTCNGCEKPSRTLPADGWCRECRDDQETGSTTA